MASVKDSREICGASFAMAPSSASNTSSEERKAQASLQYSSRPRPPAETALPQAGQCSRSLIVGESMTHFSERF